MSQRMGVLTLVMIFRATQVAFLWHRLVADFDLTAGSLLLLSHTQVATVNSGL